MKNIKPLIRYRCDNPAHQRPTTSLANTMTIHERAWAYCPRDVRLTDHLWTVANTDAPVLSAREPARVPADPPRPG